MTKGITVVKLHSPGVLQERKLHVKQIYNMEWHCIKMSTHFFFLLDFFSLILWSLKVIIHIIFKNTAPLYRKHTEFPLHFPLVNAMQGNNPNCKKLTCYKMGKTNRSAFVAAWWIRYHLTQLDFVQLNANIWNNLFWQISTKINEVFFYPLLSLISSHHSSVWLAIDWMTVIQFLAADKISSLPCSD